MASPPTLRPPFARAAATLMVRRSEDAWNARDPERVARSCAPDARWRSGGQFITGQREIDDFLRRKWLRELDYRIAKELWCFTDERIGARFQYEYREASGLWFRAYGTELWEFDAAGRVLRLEASINEVSIASSERKFHWELGAPRPCVPSGIPPSA